MSDHLASRLDAPGANSTEVDNLLGVGGRPPGACAVFPWSLHEAGPSRVIPLNAGRSHDDPVTATAGLALSTNVIRLRAQEPVATHAQASEEFYYVLRGQGRSRAGDQAREWQRGDSFVLPSGQTTVHAASEDATLLWIHDEPLFGAQGVGTRPLAIELRADDRSG
ncbi:cupin domain-containing protein [Singulisphaera acidiphila]|uniref:Cupin domain-containing protein n=1 Tax=Singulisphaera acidiphila (strain ATCC BAA-1392 / DSM 18658 / VKM B-2454 / MOB10) TaxID=886293 RepID=L0D9Y9_SINAD|nr:cupin domain-containing protein [Singulisphaera acidiphila]AGA25653.1 cupin domain-containing protein [Singulisphaera acidiphila DSM 18658]